MGRVLAAGVALLLAVVVAAGVRWAEGATEGEALLQLKGQVQQDPGGVLSSWGGGSPCNADASTWQGVSCSAGQVQSLSLPGAALSGALLDFSWIAYLPSLQSIDLSANLFTGNLSSLATCPPLLQSLNLAANSLAGSLPSPLLSNCSALRYLNLSRNAISGTFPPSFFDPCDALQVLDLSVNRISGPLPDNIGSCLSLLNLSLSHNLLDGALPSSLLSNCSDCSTGAPFLSLDLSSNNISGPFPDNLFSNCASLQSLDLSSNLLTGSLPSTLKNCAHLIALNLTANKLSSALPEFLGQLASIQTLHMARNQFSEPISATLMGALCATLQDLDLSRNNLTGSIPLTVAGCSSLRSLNLAANKLSGPFPDASLSPLQSLEVLRLTFNGFTGTVPVALMNCTKLRVLDMGGNAIAGSIPSEICPPFNTYALEQILLANNQLDGGIPSSLANCTRLVIINLSFNRLKGSIPVELSKLRNLETMSLWYNQLTGQIPPELGNMAKLRNLNLNSNFLSGWIPWQLSRCTDLEWLNLNSNQLTGEIPSQLGLLQKLTLLELGNNSLSGAIPTELGDCSSLLWLDLHSNQLKGSIPKAIGRHSTKVLTDPVLAGDQLAFVRNGPSSSCRGLGMGIMVDFAGIAEDSLAATPLTACPSRPTLYVGGSLYDNPENRTLQYLDLSYNQLTGGIPQEMGTWVSLIILGLSHNELTGTIPATFGQLHTLGVMDISNNELEGSLSVLSSCTMLVIVDVSNNLFSGQIPGGQLATNPQQSFANNSGLCGTPLPDCTPSTDASSSSSCTGAGCASKNKIAFLSVANSIVLGILVALLCVGAFVVWVGFVVKNRHRKKENALLSSLQQSSCNGSSSWNLSGEREPLSINVATFERPLRKLTFSQLIEATDGFSRESLVGTGGFGEVYKAELKDGTVVAIKKLLQFSFQGDREFMAEMETLGKIKHRNLVPLLGYCKVGEERLLVYEFMHGGSLDEVLHGSTEGRERLNWDLRKQIAKGAARGLAFLHHNCIPHIIHRDMKSSNVLLDKDLEARVSDFGMARLISALDTHLSVSTLAGTPGYVPPEYYQSFRCTTKGDVYSFGVILLELVTGQRPTDKEEFGDNNLVGWVKLHVANNNTLEVLDPILRGTGAEYEMIQYLNIACECLDDMPLRRPTMLRVVTMLKELFFEDQNSAYQHSSS